MARDVMILMQANSFCGPLEGVGPENRDFFARKSWVSDILAGDGKIANLFFTV
jgi:hypothetical protein